MLGINKATLDAIQYSIDMILVDAEFKGAEEYFRLIVRCVLSYGVFPGPSILNYLVGSVSRNNLNSSRARWRSDELRKAGYVKGNNRYEHWKRVSSVK